MARSNITGLFFFWSMAAHAVTPADNLAAYDWRARINGDLSTGFLHKVLLSPEVADRLKSFPLDIRVADADGTPWPALVWSGDPAENVDPVPSTRNPGSPGKDEKGLVRVSVSAKPPRPGAAAPLHNRVIVSLGGTEFRRMVEVWTGSDPQHLQFRARQLIAEQSTPVAFRRRTIDYPSCVDPCVEVRIHDDALRPGAPLSVRALELVHVRESNDTAVGIEAQLLDPPAGEARREDAAMVYLDTGSRNLPVMHVDLDIKPHGVFAVRVNGRAGPGDAWRWLGDGALLHHEDGSNTRIELDRSPYRYLQVVLYPDGETWPEVKAVRAGLRAHFLVFTPVTDRKAFLYAGASTYQLPAASFVRMVNATSVREARGASLSKPHENPARVARSLDHYSALLFRVGGILVLLLVAVFTARKIRNRFLS